MITLSEATKRENLELLLADACRVSFAVSQQLSLRAGGAAVTPATRDEMLAKVRAGEHVEIELDVLAYVQKSGEANRKYVRHRDGSMMSLGRSGVGKPVLRDHEQGNSLAVAGKIIDSKTEKLDDGEYRIMQTWRLTAPWAVELALRDLLSTVSIGWCATGPVLCSACNAPVFTVCYHCPGDRLSEKIGDDGVKRMVRDRAGATIVEWIYTSAELVETSLAPVPAVTSARIEGIRAALSAHDGGISPPHIEEGNHMNPKLLQLLGLAATAGDPEALSAVESLVADRAELAITSKELKLANKELEILGAEKRKTAVDAFISGALASGRIAKGDETAWRDLYELSADRAVKRMAERAEGSATPVGLPRASATNVTEDKGSTGGASTGDPIVATKQILKANNVDPDEAVRLATKFGVKDPMKAIAKHCAGQEVA